MLPNPPSRLNFKRAPGAIAEDMRKRLAQARRNVEQAVDKDGKRLIPTLELIEEDIGRRFTPLRHLNSVASTPEVREAYEQVLAALTDYETWLGQHQGLYESFKALGNQPGFARRPRAEQALVNHALIGFRLSGADLPAAKREQVRGQIAELSELGNRYEINVLDATDAWRLVIDDEKRLQGLPQATVELLAERAREQDESGWLLTLDPGVVFDVLRHADDRALREEIHGAWVSRASDAGPDAGRFDNVPVIEGILAGRRRLARTLGYPDYAAYALETRMATSADEVKGFLRELAGRAKPQAEREFKELVEFAAGEGHRGDLAAWDIGYYSEKLRKARYGFDEEAMRRYFPLERVLSGLRKLCRQLYGVRFRTDRDAPVWHEDVRVWALEGKDGRRIGRLYLDLYARPGKRGGAWMDEGGHRLRLGGIVRSPAAFLNANFMRPARGRPSLIAHDDVVTLCHELGHCLHHLLSTVDYPSVGGISGVEWDAVEFPSQLHEEFAWHPAGLAELAREVDTGASLPRTLIEALGNSRRFHGALHLVRQLEFALFDIELHTLGKDAPTIGDVRRVLEQVRQAVRVTPLSGKDRFECGFAHIFGGGYAAGYYSYLWAEVMARDGFAAFMRDDTLDFSAGRRLADTFLANGSSRPARELYKAFRGRDPDPAPLLALYGIT
ncbi:MAG TPA: M3 family metallopeptidase [Gammaproteobacteria bacterium]|nr:M3 family metallopeptidase [Gammaproteobacteria bacterium]